MTASQREKTHALSDRKGETEGEYPFADESAMGYKEAKYLGSYILKIDSPGSVDILLAMDAIGQSLDRLEATMISSRLYKFQSEYSADRMTRRYIAAQHATFRSSIARIELLLDSWPQLFDLSKEAIRPHLETQSMSIFRESRARLARIEEKQDEVDAKIEARLRPLPHGRKRNCFPKK